MLLFPIVWKDLSVFTQFCNIYFNYWYKRAERVVNLSLKWFEGVTTVQCCKAL